ncbi:hypothetical protein C8J56DRAFT_890046 [Mycena floridula]|nr:hypothetical protein C8J56DRAFT_890046 [Mycena floridula]
MNSISDLLGPIGTYWDIAGAMNIWWHLVLLPGTCEINQPMIKYQDVWCSHGFEDCRMKKDRSSAMSTNECLKVRFEEWLILTGIFGPQAGTYSRSIPSYCPTFTAKIGLAKTSWMDSQSQMADYRREYTASNACPPSQVDSSSKVKWESLPSNLDQARSTIPSLYQTLLSFVMTQAKKWFPLTKTYTAEFDRNSKPGLYHPVDSICPGQQHPASSALKYNQGVLQDYHAAQVPIVERNEQIVEEPKRPTNSE